MKLLLADDHTLFRDALVQYILRADPEANVSLAKDLYQAFDILEEDAQQDLVLLDLCMPGMDGMDGFKKMRDQYPDIPLALMSGIAEEEDVRRAIDLGAVGYFPKTLSGKALLQAIQLVLSGERFVPVDHESSNIMPSYRGDGRPKNSKAPFYGSQNSTPQSKAAGDIDLTPREQDVLKYLALGISNKEIARELGLQVVTVKLHVRGICRKLDADNRTQAALKAHHLGLVDVEDQAVVKT